jgi:hypothetical protein
MFVVNKVAGSQRNFTLHVSGVVSDGDFTPSPINLEEKHLKLASLAWIVQEKLGIYFGWTKEAIFIPMESRNAIRFDTSISAPAEWDGNIWLSSFNFVKPRKAFFLVLDFDK